MAISLISRPANVCYTRTNIIYAFRRTETSDKYVDLTFSICTTVPGTPNSATRTVTLRAWFTAATAAQCFLQDILRDEVSLLTTSATQHTIAGYVQFWLSAVNGSTTDSMVEDPENNGTHRHYAFYGENPAPLKQEGRSPFLLARPARNGTVHLYQSEVPNPLYLVYMGSIPDLYTVSYNKVNSGASPVGEADTQVSLPPLLAYTPDQPGVYTYSTLIITNNQIRPYLVDLVVDEDPEAEEKHLLKWMNKYGALESLLCTGRLESKPAFDEPETYGNSPTHIATRGRKQLSARWYTRRFTLQTGYLTEDRYAALIDMLCSPDVRLDGTSVTVTADLSRLVLLTEPQSYELNIEVLTQRLSPDNSRTVNAPSGDNFILDHDTQAILDQHNEPLTDS